jgi:biotin carboxylase
MKSLFILGAGTMQAPAIDFANDMGLKTLVVDGNAHAENAGKAAVFKHIDLRDREAMLDLARKEKIDAVMTAGTDFSAAVAYIAGELGLPGLPYQAALRASDKALMREAFAQAGVPSPQFLVYKAGEAIPRLRLPPYPLVVKPCDNMGGRGCKRVDTEAELEAALKDALPYSRSGRCIIEEYMDGPEFSVDALIFNGKLTVTGLADRHIFLPPYFIEMGHTIPTNADAATQAAVLVAFEDAVRSLGLLEAGCYGAAKGDLKMTGKGPKIGEIAARLSGGYMSGWTYPLSSGVELTRGAIYAALGEEAPAGLLEPKKHWVSAERAFISEDGIVESIEGFDRLLERPGVEAAFLRVKPGDRVNLPQNNVEKCGNVISAAPTREEAVRIAEEAAASVKILLKA